MSADLKEVIRYLVHNAKNPPTKTSLIKLVYMADYYHWRLYGEQLTECEYRLQHYGAVCFDIPDTAREMDGEELTIKQIIYGNGFGWIYEPGPKAGSPFRLSARQKDILDLVVTRHSVQTLPMLKKAHYETEPMQKVEKGGRLDMTTIKRIPAIGNREGLKALQDRISKMDLKVSGSPEKRAELCEDVMSSLELARKRATTAAISGEK